MKKILCILTVLFVTAQSFALGVEFQTSYTNFVGLNLELMDQFELKPQIAFSFGDNSYFGILVDGNYYFFESMDLRHYAGGSLLLGFQEDQDTEVLLGGHYGLRYHINDVLSLFGEVGIRMDFDPDFILSSVHPGLGLTFYIR